MGYGRFGDLRALLFGCCCFDLRHTGGLPIHGEASAKAALYKDRFLLLFQRLARDQHFSKPAFDTEMSHFGSCEVLFLLGPLLENV